MKAFRDLHVSSCSVFHFSFFVCIVYIFVKCIIQSVFLFTNRSLVQRISKLSKYKTKDTSCINSPGRLFVITSKFSCFSDIDI